MGRFFTVARRKSSVRGVFQNCTNVRALLESKITVIFRAGNGMWASKISIVSPESGAVLHSIELEQNQGIHSICLTKFQSVGMIDWYLLAGTSNSMILNPRHSQGTPPTQSNV